MTSPLIDYDAVLADLTARRAAAIAQFDAAIAAIASIRGGTVPEGDVPTGNGDDPLQAIAGGRAAVTAAARVMGATLQSDTFFGMSTAAAIRKFLAMTKRPQSPRAIADALRDGGQVHAMNDKVAYRNVYSALMRMKDTGDAVQIKSGDWGLAEWYSNKPKAESE